mgnify:CR=1 FL=1
MFQNPEQVLLIASVILFFSIFAGKAGYRFGLPALLLFLGVGMLFGSDGLGIQFSDPNVAQFIGMLALSIILFSGGMDTKVADRLARCGIGYARGVGYDLYHGQVYLLVIWFIWQICYVDFPGIFIAGGGHVLYGLSLGFLHLAQ